MTATPPPFEPTHPGEHARLAFAASQLRDAAALAGRELDHAVLPLEGDPEGIRIVAVQQVESWLAGLAIRVENSGAVR